LTKRFLYRNIRSTDSRRTVSVICARAGVDSAWEQERPEARKMLDAKRAARRKAAVPSSGALSWRSSMTLCWAAVYGVPLDPEISLPDLPYRLVFRRKYIYGSYGYTI
jgi:hypothetical protein